MAKKPNKAFDVEVLKAVALACSAGGNGWVTQANGKPLLDAGLIVVDTNTPNPANANERAAKVTEAGIAWLNANVPAPGATAPAQSAFPIITNAVLPPSKRGSGLRSAGAPKKYPFDQLEIGGSFFVPVSAEVPEPMKSLGSAVSAANMRYAEDTGTTKKAKRAVKDSNGDVQKDAAGKLVKAEVDVPVYKYSRKFAIRGVEKGTKYGEWVAPADGALIARVSVE